MENEKKEIFNTMSSLDLNDGKDIKASAHFSITEHFTRSFSSSISIEARKSTNLLETLNTVSQIINTETIMKVFVQDSEDINKKNELDLTPLYRTIIGGNNTATEHLLKNGADPNIKCNAGETALYYAVETEKIPQVETLLKFGADPNLARNDGWTPLHAAVLKQNLSLIETLLKANANPNLQNNIFNQTPVHFAIKKSVKCAILLLLVQYKGSLSIRDKDNKRPFDYAETKEMKEAISKLKMEREDIFFTPQKERVLSFQSNTRGNNNLSMQNVNAYEAGLAFTLNPNNIDQFVAQNTNLEYNTSQVNQNNQNINRTPVKHTTNYIYVIKSSDKKLHYKSSRKKARLIETETEIKETESDQKTKDIKNEEFSPSDKNFTLGTNYNLSQIPNTHHDRENLNFDKFSFVTKEGQVLSKLISPRERDDGALSDINPIDSISNYNTNNNNRVITMNSNSNVTPQHKNELRKEDCSQLIIHNTSGNKSSQVHITATDENESDNQGDDCHYLDSLENRKDNTDRIGEPDEDFNIEGLQINEGRESQPDMKVRETIVKNNKYSKENMTSSCQYFKSDEESVSMSLSVCKSQISQAPSYVKKEKNINENYRITEANCDEEKSYASNLKTVKSSIVHEVSPEQDVFELTPSKTSYIISDLPVTSVKKSENEDPYRTIKKRLDYDSFGEKNSSHQINTNANPNSSVISKIHYHKESKSLNNSNLNLTNTNTTFSNAMQMQMQNNKYSHLQQESEMNPRYKIRTAFQLPYMPKLRKNLSPEVMRKINYSEQENFLTVEDERPFNTQANLTMNRVRSGNNSTRNNSTRYNTSYEDNFLSNRIGRKKIYLQEQVNPHDTSNKTIIHHGEREVLTTQGNSNLFNTNYSRYNNDNQMTYTPGNCVTCHNCNTKVKKVSTLTEFSRRGSPVSNRHNHVLDTIYCQTDTNRSAISTKDAKKLHDWLNNIGMQNYYNNFLEKGIFSIDRVIEGMQDIRSRMSYKDFEELGVRKPGHIHRMLLQLEVDSKMIDDTVYNLLIGNKLNKSNENSLERSNFRCNLKISSEKFVCCGMIPKNRVDVSNGENKFNNKFSNDNNGPYLTYDLISWLKTIKMPNLRKHFIHNGFDSMEYFILQMFSMNPIDDAFLEDNLHIYSTKERRIILSQLAKEVKAINDRLYCNSNMNSFIYDDTDRMKCEKENVEDGCKMCIIF